MQEEPIFEIGDVAIVGGETNRDPRLQGIDLRGRLETFVLTVLSPEGRRVDNGKVYVVGEEPVAGLRQSLNLDGHDVYIVTTRPSLDLDILVPGCRTLHLAGMDGDRSVVLERGFPVRLHVSGVTIPEPPLYLAVQLWSAGEQWQTTPASGVQNLDREGYLQLFVSEAGRYSVRLLGRCDLGTGWSSHSTGFGEDAVIDVASDGGERVFELTLTPEQLQELIGKFQD